MTQMELQQLLTQCQEIRPEIEYLYEERYVGKCSKPRGYWAHSRTQAWAGDTPEELIADVRKIVGVAV